MYPELLTTDDAAEFLSVSRRTLIRLTNAGVVPVIRNGRLVRYSRTALQQWGVDNSRFASAAAANRPVDETPRRRRRNTGGVVNAG
ncbi:MAG: helix-turn-helix domain-containing protein [Acidimicrobiia bacterium]